MIEGIRYVIYTRRDMLGIPEYFELNINGNERTIKYNEQSELRVKKIDDESIIEFLDNLFRIIDSWKETYIKTDVLDGTEWQLTIKYKDGRTKEYFGQNDFPINFPALERTKNKTIEKLMETDV